MNFKNAARWLTCAVMVLLTPLCVMVAYFNIACPHENPVGWAILQCIAVVFYFPFAAVVYMALMLGCWPMLNALKPELQFGTLMRRWVLALAAVSVLVWGASFLTHATARCSVLG